MRAMRACAHIYAHAFAQVNTARTCALFYGAGKRAALPEAVAVATAMAMAMRMAAMWKRACPGTVPNPLRKTAQPTSLAKTPARELPRPSVYARPRHGF